MKRMILFSCGMVIIIALFVVSICISLHYERYNKTYFIYELLPELTLSDTQITEVRITNAKKGAVTVFQDEDFITTFQDAIDGIVLREVKVSETTDGIWDTVHFITAKGEIGFSFSGNYITYNNKRYSCNTDRIQQTLKSLYVESETRNGSTSLV